MPSYNQEFESGVAAMMEFQVFTEDAGTQNDVSDELIDRISLAESQIALIQTHVTEGVFNQMRDEAMRRLANK